MTLAQLTYREDLRDIESCLRAQRNKLQHEGIGGGISHNALANAHKLRDRRICTDLAHNSLILIAHRLCVDEDFGIDLDNNVHALDTSAIDQCLSLLPTCRTRAAVRRQIWVIISVYVLVACVKKRLDIIVSLYTILQLLSLSVLRRISLNQPLTDATNAHGGSALTNRIEFTQANIGTLNGFENKFLILPRGRQLRDIPRTEVGVGNQ